MRRDCHVAASGSIMGRHFCCRLIKVPSQIYPRFCLRPQANVVSICVSYRRQAYLHHAVRVCRYYAVHSRRDGRRCSREQRGAHHLRRRPASHLGCVLPQGHIPDVVQQMADFLERCCNDLDGAGYAVISIVPIASGRTSYCRAVWTLIANEISRVTVTA